MYNPREDSYFLSSILKDHLNDFDKGFNILDMGSGSGIQAKTCRDLHFKNVTAADIDEKTVSFLKNKGFKVIKTDLFSSINEKFDLIIFNPPYLPEHKYDNEKDTTGGKKGYETILKFLKQSKNHLTKKGRIILLYSSLSKPRVIKKQAKEMGYKINLLGKKKISYEELFVVELWMQN